MDFNKQRKITKGQYFTKEQIWLKPHIVKFINDSKCSIAYDPFAGAGDLINNSEQYGISEKIGLDIDDTLGWKINDSLISIPHKENSIIITNPPYLSNYSASRKKIYQEVKKYFETSIYNDLYLIALDKMLDAQDYVVAIIPETFINSNYRRKNRLVSITILEDNPFIDTDTPVCIACFNGKNKEYNKISIYKNNTKLFSFEELNNYRIYPKKNIDIKFNILDGWLGFRAVDTTNPNNTIKFDFKENFNYDWNKGIKQSSRLLSIIDINIPYNDRNKFIKECNKILRILRKQTSDIILSPFKGNMKNGVRRRRLDFLTARAILEQAYSKLFGRK